MTDATNGGVAADDRTRSVERACDYAVGSFEIRMAQIEGLRNRSLVALGLMSAPLAVLAATGVMERLRSVLWLPLCLFAFAFVLALVPLLSVQVVHPVKLKSLHSHIGRYTAGQIDEALLRDTAEADTLGESLARATAVYTDNALRVATVGLAAFMLPLAAPGMTAREAAALGLLVGAFALGLVELGRMAIRLSVRAD